MEINAYAAQLRDCRSVAQVESIHTKLARTPHGTDRFLSNLLIQMYGACGSLDKARKVFDSMENRNSHSWSIMITAYARKGHLCESESLISQMPLQCSVAWNALIGGYIGIGLPQQALFQFRRMLFLGDRPDKVTFLCALDACRYGLEAREIHRAVVDAGVLGDIMVGTSLVDTYGKCGHPLEARGVFEDLPSKNVVTWNAMVNVYVHNRCTEEARKCFDEMPERDADSWNTLIAAYCKQGHLQCAWSLFTEVPVRDAVTWNTMISSLSHHGCWRESLWLFRVMDLEGGNPDNVTYVAALEACCSSRDETRLGEPELTTKVFQEVMTVRTVIEAERRASPELLRDVTLSTALLSTCGRWGDLPGAQRIFHNMLYKNVVTWNALIAANAENGHFEQAVQLFSLMDQEGICPSRITAINVLDACAGLSNLGLCRTVHGVIEETHFIDDVAVGTAVVHMYAECGSLPDAWTCFTRMPEQNALSWNVILAAYARKGRIKEAATLFKEMQLQGVTPDPITFTIVLSKCSHLGTLDEACQLVSYMHQDYGVTAVPRHYRCLVDLLGRLGVLTDAEKLIRKIALTGDPMTWKTLLGACKIHGEVELANRINEQLLSLGSETAASFISFCNINSSSCL